MHIKRHIQRAITFVPRRWHRHGFGVQSPFDYELVKDVLFENLAYYAYEDLNLKSKKEKQLYRLKLRFGDKLICADKEAHQKFEQFANSPDDSYVMVIENISGKNHFLWLKILQDKRATVTYDLGNRGLVLFNRKRIKQNYLL